mgnify:CR=1 FL=1
MNDEVKELLIDIISQSDEERIIERAKKILKKYRSNKKSSHVDPFDLGGVDPFLESSRVKNENEW